jgi:RNA polymerase sigma factor (sigma-70 family)
MTAISPDVSDAILLQRYAAGDRDAFNTLALRHIDWIYGTALRLSRDPGSADDVAQAVLVALSQKAGTLQHHSALHSWLFRAVTYAARTHRRSERRRKLHEAGMTTPSAPETPDFDLQHTLDAAVARLPATEREAVLLRFYHQLPHAGVAAALQVSEDAARFRVERALVRLRKILGVGSTTAALSASLTTALVATAPRHLQAAVAAGVPAAKTVALSKAIHTALVLTKLKIAAVVLAVLLPAITLTAIIHYTSIPAAQVPLVSVSKLGPAATAPVATTEPSTAPANVLAGIVLDEQHQPAANILVFTPGITPGYTVRTTSDGRFQISFPAPQDYVDTLVARSDDRLHQAYFPRQFDTHAFPFIRLTLAPAREFPVTVADVQHRPMPGTQMYASDDFDSIVGDAITDPSGHAALRIPATAPLSSILAVKDHVGIDYRLFRNAVDLHSNPVLLEPTFTGPLAFTFDGVRTVVVRTIDEQGKPIQGASVYPWYIEKPDHGGGVELAFLLSQHRDFTDAQGTVEFPFIPRDAVNGVGGWIQDPQFATPVRWMWKPSDTDDAIVCTLPSLVPLAGIVRDAQGHPIADAVIRIAGAGNGLDQFNATPTTHADGTFTVKVDPEKYYALFAAKDVLASPVAHCMIHRHAPAGPIVLTLGPAIHVFGRVTVGDENRPARHVDYLNFNRRDDSYNALPAVEKFSGKPARGDIDPQIGQSAAIDAQGRFDFYAPPGPYYLDTGIGSERITTEVPLTAEETEKEVPLHADSDSRTPTALRGKVILASAPDVIVPEIFVHGYLIPRNDTGMVDPEGITHRDGTFEIRAAKSPMYLLAYNKANTLAALLRVNPDDNDLVLQLAPTATVHGRLLDAAGKPWAGQQLYCSIWPMKDFLFYFPSGYVKTAIDGTFTLPGIIPKLRCTLSMQDPQKENQTLNLTNFHPQSAAPLDVGDLTPRAFSTSP